ncbi:MBL fold metallo-hydrolase [Mesobacillus maritimus]|uniref:MBL fold metallo-hydrolase n=1 Tax=Mesobacillus maritimus TaxID=1643336 RepID=A0ABS7K7B4_9BACI|nr:MBL fold metallo-hydrolase [Mesobacillus maritimus]MBY0098162.1 MBL fold metallo-hydrolase [Mesobacillus maritimus]
MMYLLIFALLFVAALSLFIYINPVFGGRPSRKETEAYHAFDHYVKGKFVFPRKGDSGALHSTVKPEHSVSAQADRSPKGQVPVSTIDWDKVKSSKDSLTWFGHSAFLLSIDQKKLFVDPMLGPIASPVSFVGPKRYSEKILDLIEEMPPIDAVLITHDHYDHLDYPSIQKLKNKAGHFFVPLGVGAHLIRWGVAQDTITELNWWEEIQFQGLTLALTPSKHFSGRGIFNRNSTLWGGWVILGKQTRFFTSGDGGYDGHFKEIGEKYGPFDIALIEGGQYDRRWYWAHMFPEQSVQANVDVKGKTMMLIHWGAFTLARHSWTDPIERALKEAESKNVHLIAPKIGETILLTESPASPPTSWWNL